MTEAPALDILVLTDLHYSSRENEIKIPPGVEPGLGPGLIGEACDRLRAAGVQPDLALTLGDLVHGTQFRDAEADLEAVAAALRALELPLLAVPGNHDDLPERYAGLFGFRTGLHVHGGYGFLLFNDPTADDGITTRPDDTLGLPARAAAAHPGLPLVAVQHNPLHPPIEHDYPYLPTNTDAILSGYAAAGVLLSLSGHYHPGQPPRAHAGTVYTAVPALGRPPCSFAHVRLHGRRADVQVHTLRPAAC
ncbi:MAG: metallophosphoesterase [Lentisphaerae bacterium]|nr:metallophosphoesterase [Lentisphaerota bacterium]